MRLGLDWQVTHARPKVLYICAFLVASNVQAVLQALPGQNTPEGVPAFKLVLVGDGGTGMFAW